MKENVTLFFYLVQYFVSVLVAKRVAMCQLMHSPFFSTHVREMDRYNYNILHRIRKRKVGVLYIFLILQLFRSE